MKNLWDFIMSMYSSHPFLTGFALGLIVCVVVILIFWLVVRIFCSSKVSVFSYPVDNGRVTIRASAVTSLIFSLEKNFSELVIVKAGLYRKGEQISLRVLVDYRQGGRPFPEVVSLFQQSVLEKLKETLGVETVNQMEVCMRDSIEGSRRDSE